MEQNNKRELDAELKRDIKDCKEKAEFIERVLTMIVKGFISEY